MSIGSFLGVALVVSAVTIVVVGAYCIVWVNYWWPPVDSISRWKVAAISLVLTALLTPFLFYIFKNSEHPLWVGPAIAVFLSSLLPERYITALYSIVPSAFFALLVFGYCSYQSSNGPRVHEAGLGYVFVIAIALAPLLGSFAAANAGYITKTLWRAWKHRAF